MTTRHWIANNFLLFVGCILLVIIYLQRCNQSPLADIVRTDTTIIKSYYYKDTTIIHNPTLVKTVPTIVKVTDTQWIADKNYDKLLTQYLDIRDKYLAKNIFKDTLPVDSIGTAYIEDSVTRNSIASRKIKYNLKIPKDTVKINTTTTTHKNIWLIGGSIEGNKITLVNQINADIMLLNKRNKGYKIGTGIDVKGNVYYRFGLYWKL